MQLKNKCFVYLKSTLKPTAMIAGDYYHKSRITC